MKEREIIFCLFFFGVAFLFDLGRSNNEKKTTFLSF